MKNRVQQMSTPTLPVEAGPGPSGNHHNPPVAPKAFVAFFQYRDDADGQRFVEGSIQGGGVLEDSEPPRLHRYTPLVAGFVAFEMADL